MKKLMVVDGCKEVQKKAEEDWLYELKDGELDSKGEFYNLSYLMIKDGDTGTVFKVDGWIKRDFNGNVCHQLVLCKSRGLAPHAVKKITDSLCKDGFCSDKTLLDDIEGVFSNSRPEEVDPFEFNYNQLSLEDAKLAVANYYGVEEGMVSIFISC